MAPPNDDEARRLAELERQRQEEERRKWERLRAPQVIRDNASLSGEPGRNDAGNGVSMGRDLDFSSLYPDPVKEALRELKRERAGTKPDRLPR